MTVEILRYVNLSVNATGILIILVIIICLSMGENKADRMNKLFIRGLFACILYMFSEALAWLLKGNPDKIWALRIANDMVFLSGYLILITFTAYLLSYLSKDEPAPSWIMAAIDALGASGVLLIIVNRFTGIIYIIDSSGYYQRGSLILLTQLTVIIGVLIDTLLIWKYRRKLDKSRWIIMTSYTILPLAAVILQLTVYGIPVLSVGFLTSSVLVFAGVQSQQAKRIKEQELENQEQKIAVMLSQIQPHFLFNALLSIKYLCKTDAAEAGEAVDQFSRYLRRNLEALENRKPIPFSEELEHVTNYLALEKRRYKELLRLEFDIQTTAFCLPALTLQPLAENAVRYGVSKNENGGTIKITTRETEETFVITIEDDGPGFDPNVIPNDGKTHIGIKNVTQRLAYQCGGTVLYSSEIGKGTVVTIFIKK